MIIPLLAWAFSLAGTAPVGTAVYAPAERLRDDVGMVAVQAVTAQAAPVMLSVDTAAGFRPVLRLGAVLEDASLQKAVESGLPLRLQFRVELWREALFDQLVASESWIGILRYEPLGGTYIVHTQANPTQPTRLASYASARSVLERGYPLPLWPSRPGRYYYTAVTEIETFSLSDFDELGHWLQGEFQPAVSGEHSMSGAITQGLKRFFIRVLRLPARRFYARSGRFDIV